MHGIVESLSFIEYVKCCLCVIIGFLSAVLFFLSSLDDS